MDTLLNVATRFLLIEIAAEDKLCNAHCPYFTIFRTGLIGEWHPHCDLFLENGEWQKNTMKRVEQCLKAENEAVKKCVKT